MVEEDGHSRASWARVRQSRVSRAWEEGNAEPERHRSGSAHCTLVSCDGLSYSEEDSQDREADEQHHGRVGSLGRRCLADLVQEGHDDRHALEEAVVAALGRCLERAAPDDIDPCTDHREEVEVAEEGCPLAVVGVANSLPEEVLVDEHDLDLVDEGCHEHLGDPAGSH